MGMNLKVLWITSDFPTHLESDRYLYLWHALEALKKIGVKPVVLHTPAWKPFEKRLFENTCFPVEINTCRYLSIPRHYFRAVSNFLYLFQIIPKIKKLNKLHHFDVIHAHGEICGLAAIKASQKLNIPAIVTVHGIDMCPRMCKGYAKKMFQRMFNHANKIIYVGEPLQKHFQEIIGNNERGCIVHNGFKIPFNLKLVNFVFKSKKTIRLVSVSNLHEGKGVDLTLQALGYLKNKGIKNWSYTIIGDGNQKNYLENIILQFDLSNYVTFLGSCTHEIVYENLKKSDIFCLPSYREAFGIVYVEAMAHGLLTIGVKGQGPQAFIKHGETGFLVESNNLDSLINTLGLVIIQYHDILPIALAGQKYVLENFTWEKHAEKLLSVYKEVSV